MATLRALVLATTIAALLGCGLGSQGPETEDRAPGRIPRAEAVIASVAGAEAESRAIAEAILGASDPVLAAAQAGQGLWTAARAYAAASLDDRPLTGFAWPRPHTLGPTAGQLPFRARGLRPGQPRRWGSGLFRRPHGLTHSGDGLRPLLLDRNIDQQPSGVGALRLDGTR